VWAWESKKYCWASISPGVIVHGAGSFCKHTNDNDNSTKNDECIDERDHPFRGVPSQIFPLTKWSMAVQKWDENVEEWSHDNNINV
jgi:hypothetical protein